MIRSSAVLILCSAGNVTSLYYFFTLRADSIVFVSILSSSSGAEREREKRRERERGRDAEIERQSERELMDEECDKSSQTLHENCRKISIRSKSKYTKK